MTEQIDVIYFSPIKKPYRVSSTDTSIGEEFRVFENKVIQTSEAQTWFWSHSWQEGEQKAQSDIEAGRTRRFESANDLIEALNLE